MEKFQNKGAKIVLSGKTEPMDPYETGWELAQLVERLIYTRRVTGSNPVLLILAKYDIQAMKEYLREWNERNYLLFLFGINSGLRVGDILQVRVKDVQGWYIKVKEQKTGKRKQLKMTKTLKKEIREYIKDKPLHHYLFQSRIGKNKPLDRRTVDWILKTAAIECGIENIGTHSMRKTFGYHYYKKTKDVAMLMDLFNHSSPAITLRYIGIRQDQRDKAMSNFDL